MWLFVPTPSTLSASALAGEDSISDWNWQSRVLAASCSWRGKPSPSAIWSARCNKVSWLRRLSGAMLPPSQADLGAASWMASLAASRASLIASPASAKVLTTSVTSGPTPAASLSKPARGSSSSRTSAACSRRSPASIRARYGSGVTYADWVSALREDCLRRQRSAQAMNASESSFSLWPTMRCGDGITHPLRENVADPRGRLEDVVANWPTPAASEARLGFQDRSDPTKRGTQESLSTVAMLWSSPRASDGEKGGPNQSFGAGGIPLAAQTVQWATPSVADTTGGRMTRSGDRSGEELLKGQANTLASSLPVQTTYDVGETSSKPRRSLNPLFVEWLMGWPPGWTLLAWTDFACSATALCHYKRLMRSALLQLASPQTAPPQQLGLFA